jgi:hypothetical protein
LLKIFEDFFRFLLVHPAEGKAGVNDDVIPHLDFGHVG